jgi:hypothetical protein
MLEQIEWHTYKCVTTTNKGEWHTYKCVTTTNKGEWHTYKCVTTTNKGEWTLLVYTYGIMDGKNSSAQYTRDYEWEK